MKPLPTLIVVFIAVLAGEAVCEFIADNFWQIVFIIGSFVATFLGLIYLSNKTAR